LASVLKYFGVVDNLISDIKSLFLTTSSIFNLVVFNAKTQEIILNNTKICCKQSKDRLTTPIPTLRSIDPDTQAAKFFKWFKEKDKALAIFSLIYNTIHHSAIDLKDCTIHLQLQKSKKKLYSESIGGCSSCIKLKDEDKREIQTIQISLIDYIVFILTEKEKPTHKFLLLHRYITKRTKIPKSLIRNVYLL
jgi:hypothetical protein